MSRADAPAECPEAGSLASDLAHAYGRMVAFYRDQLEMSGLEADARARGSDDTPAEAAADLARIRDRPPDQVGWFDLNRVANRDPQAVADLWDGLRAAARNEFDTGHRAARALDWDGGPWDRARFLAIRDSFRADYLPAPGIESALVDLAAEALGDYLEWTEAVHRQAGTEMERERNDLERHGKRKPRHVWTNELMAESARMAERAHARFLRTIAALGDLSRSAPVYVGHVTIVPQHVTIARVMSEED